MYCTVYECMTMERDCAILNIEYYEVEAINSSASNSISIDGSYLDEEFNLEFECILNDTIREERLNHVPCEFVSFSLFLSAAHRR